MIFNRDHEKKFTCVVYTRISDQEPEEISPSDTIESQRDICESFLKTRPHWKYIKIKYEDRNYSGGTLDRPAFKRLLQDAEQGKFDMILVKSIDRFSRDLQQFFQVWPKLKEYGVNICCASQTFSTDDATGKLILQVLLSFAEFERQLASERTKDRMRFRAKKGLFHGGYPPLGYDFHPTEKGILKVNSREAKIAKRIFIKYVELQSANLVAKYFNSLGYRTKNWKTKKGHGKGGNKFTEGIILNILKNSAYIGKTEVITRKGEKEEKEYFQATWKAIISKKLFDRIQRIISSNAQTKGSISENKYGHLLRGLVWCDCCKSQMAPNYSLKKGTAYLYYKCTRVGHSDKNACRIRSVPARELEQIVVDRIKFIANQKDIIKSIVNVAMKASTNKLPALQKEKAEIAGKLIKNSNKAKPLIAYIGRKNSSYVDEELGKLEEEKLALENRFQELNLEIEREKSKILNPEIIAQNLKLFGEVFDRLPPTKQSELLHLIIKKIIYHEEPSKIKITFYDLPEIETPDLPKKGKSGGSVSRFDKRMNPLPGEGSNLGHPGYDLTHITVRVGLYLCHIFSDLGSECLVSAPFLLLF